MIATAPSSEHLVHNLTCSIPVQVEDLGATAHSVASQSVHPAERPQAQSVAKKVDVISAGRGGPPEDY